MKALRIGYARIFQETCSFASTPTVRSSFERLHLLRGEALARACALHRSEFPGFVRNAELSGFVHGVQRHNARRALGLSARPKLEAVPLVSALAMPSGHVTPETFAWLCDELVQALKRAGELDGVYLALHGSMQVKGMAGSPEERLVDVIQQHRPKLPVSASLDLHCHLTPGLVEKTVVLCPYQTNPHRDMFSVGRRAGELLAGTLSGELKPTVAWRKLPVVVGGGLNVDFVAPMRQVFRHLKALEGEGALYAAVCSTHPYTEEKDASWAVYVATHDDQAKAERGAEALAHSAWEAARQPIPELLGPAAAFEQVAQARWARKTGVVSLVDTGDITGAGASGGSTWMLKELVERRPNLEVYLPVRDPVALEELWQQEAPGEVEVVVRGMGSEQTQNPAVTVRGRLLGKYLTGASGRAVTIDLQPGKLVLTELAPLTMFPSFFRQVGLNPWKADAVVQKTLFHYRWYYLLLNRKNIGLASPGETSFENLKSIQRLTPMLPYQEVEDWTAHDRTLRGQGAPAL